MTYFLCDAGVTLRKQIDRRWPKRDKASDGWIGDASHQAARSDHNPCWTCTGASYGVVRAIDIDKDFDKDDPGAAQRFANQLIGLARAGKDNGRLAYVIFNGWIASGTYESTFWSWRKYDGSNQHTEHIHVSFTAKGDHRGGRFRLPIFKGALRRKLVALRERLVVEKSRLVKRIKEVTRKIKRTR